MGTAAFPVEMTPVCRCRSGASSEETTAIYKKADGSGGTVDTVSAGVDTMPAGVVDTETVKLNDTQPDVDAVDSVSPN